MDLIWRTVQAATYLPGLFIGLFILQLGWLDGWQMQSGVFINTLLMASSIRPLR
jgi:hypothetical protein